MALTPQDLVTVLNDRNITAEDLGHLLDTVLVRTAANPDVEGTLAMLGITFGVVGSGTGGGGGFDPTSITGLKLWLKADALALADGDPVGTWVDASGQANDCTASGSARPTFKASILNGLPVVRFDGTNTILESLTPALANGDSPMSLFVVAKQRAATASFPAYFSIGQDWNPTNDYAMYGFNNALYLSNQSNDRATADNVTVFGTFYLLEIITSPGALSSSNPKFFINGISQASTQGTGTGTPALITSGYRVGDIYRYAGNKLDGDIAEILLYDSALSDGDRAAVEGYLTARYGL